MDFESGLYTAVGHMHLLDINHALHYYISYLYYRVNSNKIPNTTDSINYLIYYGSTEEQFIAAYKMVHQKKIALLSK